jgi:hypothetical protein
MKNFKHYNFDESNFDAESESRDSFEGYRQRLTKQNKSPFSRLGWN